MIGWIVENTSTCGVRFIATRLRHVDGQRVLHRPAERAVLRALDRRSGMAIAVMLHLGSAGGRPRPARPRHGLLGLVAGERQEHVVERRLAHGRA